MTEDKSNDNLKKEKVLESIESNIIKNKEISIKVNKVLYEEIKQKIEENVYDGNS